MSSPGGSAGLTPGTSGVTGTDGSVPAKATHTQANVTQSLQDSFTSEQFSGLGGGLIAMILSFVGGALAGILGGFVSVIDAIFGTVNSEYLSGVPIIQAQAGSIEATRAAAVTTSVIAGQTVTRYVYTGNGTWTKPTPPTGQHIARIGAAAVNGGNGGNGPAGGPGDGSEGGEGGGYTYKEWADTDVSSTITITVGAGGTGGGLNTYGQQGGTSSFGSLLTGSPGTSNIVTVQGAMASTSAAGRGGNGGGGGHSDGSSNTTYSYASPGLRGQSSALCVGGAGGSPQGTGFAAGTTGTDSQIISGGGGGGGGGGSAAASGSIGAALRPGGGGSGTAPGGGGGGGGGGYKAGIGVGDWLPGGGAGNGTVAVWVYYEDN